MYVSVLKQRFVRRQVLGLPLTLTLTLTLTLPPTPSPDPTPNPNPNPTPNNLTPNRQADLSDAELAELWRLPLAEAFANHASGFVDARINAGSSQNVAHVHLKAQLYLPT